MIGYLKGRILFVKQEYCIVETGGVGYQVFMAASALSRLERGQEAHLHIYTSVREDAISLYGFFDQEEHVLFLALLNISGIGPKVALGILSCTTPDAFRLAILKNDVKALTQLPGVGKKTAERLLLELRDKLGGLPYAAPDDVTLGDGALPTAQEEAIQALLSLGYNSGEFMSLVKKLAKEHSRAEDIIKAVLKSMAGR